MTSENETSPASIIIALTVGAMFLGIFLYLIVVGVDGIMTNIPMWETHPEDAQIIHGAMIGFIVVGSILSGITTLLMIKYIIGKVRQ